MARMPIIAGNWKMHNKRAEAEQLAREVVAATAATTDVEIVLCPPFTSLEAVAKAIAGSRVKLGAQNCHFEEKGAFTGEVSVPMLKELGVEYVIIGHSERRQYFAETDAAINRKAQTLYAHGVTPIICVGETLEEREAGRTAEVVSTQVRGCLAGLPADKVAASVIAYEPVWAIGTGRTATKEQAQEVHALIRKLVAEMFTPDVAAALRIQYGGSVKPENARELMSQPDIDGALVGGASLKAESFAGIVNFNK
ncbi:MAG: triose-phosphate isomerase [Candidatus Sumerlaeaceae bacterium]|nr:triose-phosphate isomerase [Candidatus Sumerlaeaceae bacterium]